MKALVAVVALILAGSVGVASAGTVHERSVQAAPAAVYGSAARWALPVRTRVSGTVVLTPRNPSALRSFIAAVSDRRSIRFGQYLKPGAFATRFGPAPATVSGVAAALSAGGLHVSSVSASRLLVRFSGTAGEVRTALGTGLERYRTSSGVTADATTSAVRLPAPLAGAVTAVVGLDTIAARRHTVPHPSPSAAANHRAARAASIAHAPAGTPRPCTAARHAAVGDDGLTDDQIADAYGAYGLYRRGDLGAGRHIALYENEPFLRSDIRTFDTCYFGARRAAAMQKRLHVYSVDGGQPSGPGSGEASLDVEDVSALAPGATIDVYQGPYTGTNPTDYDSFDEYAAIVDADRDAIVSSSWGLCEQSVQGGQPGIQQAENVVFEQAAAQGQTVFSAAGDNGSDDCNSNETPVPAAGQDPLSVDDPSSQPYVIAVGGTAIDDADPKALVEQVWNDGPRGGAGGGGISESWMMPSWQAASRVRGIVRPGGPVFNAAASAQRHYGYAPGFCQSTLSGAGACRLLPDVSAQADEFTGSITVFSRAYAGTSFSKNGWTTTGGTSSAAPLWAATLALVDGSSGCRGTSGVGFVAPQLYAVASNSALDRASFNDVTIGNNDVDGIGGGALYAATRGFDLATGLGSPRLTGPGGGAGLASALCSVARSAAARRGHVAASRPSVIRVSPSAAPVTGGTQMTITGTGFDAGVAGVQVGGRALARSAYRVTSPTTIVVTVPPASSQAPPAAPAPQDGSGPANVLVTLDSGVSSPVSAAARLDYVDGSATGAVATVDAVAPSGGLETAPGAVTLIGSGFSGATHVLFGGVAATGVTVNSPYRITVAPPPLSDQTACSPLPAGETRSDLCQVAVQVVNGDGTSSAGTIEPPYEGKISTDSLGDVKLPPGCGCEGVTAPDEYDYVPAPHITSISTSSGPAQLASERGGTTVTIRGTGLSALVLDWANIGNPKRAASVDTDYRSLSTTEIRLAVPGQPRSVGTRRVALSVKTLAGQAATARLTYAGVPQVTGVSTVHSRRRLAGISGAPDTGGTEIRVTGRGVRGQVAGAIEFLATGSGASAGTDYRFSVHGGSLLTDTVAQSAALVDVRACTVTGCSATGRHDRLFLFAPGAPEVSSIAPSSGPVAGGTRVVVRGADLGCPLSVLFGKAQAHAVRGGVAPLDCGATAVLSAKAPAGRAGSAVAVHVVTVTGVFTGQLGTSSARFHYTG